MEPSFLPSILKEISEVLPREISIAVSDSSRFIYYQPSPSLDLKIKPGDLIKEGSLTRKALKIRKKVSQFVERDIFGIPYYGTSIPIIQGDHAEGCVTAIYSPLGGGLTEKTQRKPSFLIGKADDRWIPVPFQDIQFIDSCQGKTRLHTSQDTYLNKYSLSELETILPDEFIRCHRSYIVSVHAIAEIQPDFHSTFILVMKDRQQTRVPVSQTHASHFRKYLGF